MTGSIHVSRGVTLQAGAIVLHDPDGEGLGRDVTYPASLIITQDDRGEISGYVATLTFESGVKLALCNDREDSGRFGPIDALFYLDPTLHGLPEIDGTGWPAYLAPDGVVGCETVCKVWASPLERLRPDSHVLIDLEPWWVAARLIPQVARSTVRRPRHPVLR